MPLPSKVTLSYYLLDWPCPDKPGQGFLFSTKKGASCLVSEETIAALKQGHGDESIIKALTRLGMLIDDSAREREEMLSFPETLDNMSSTLRVLVTLGMGCNFGCHYCYEGEKSGGQLSDTTITQLISCIQNLCTEKIRKLRLDFYGGEPLLYTERIRKLVDRLQPWAVQQKISFSFSLVSNGSLLTAQVVGELLGIGLGSVRITIDGPPEFHNQSRPYKNGRPSFETIIKNVKECCRLVPISIGGNYSRSNYQYFQELLDIFLENNLGPAQLKSVNFSPIMQTGKSRRQGYKGGCAWCGEPWVGDAAVFLRAETLRRGFAVNRLSPSPCMMQRENIFMVNWDGLFYKCPVLINRPEFSAGALPGLPDHARMAQAKDWQEDEQCCACRYLPLCFGGCAVMRLERKGILGGTDCWRPFYEKVIPAFVQQDLQWAMKSSD